MSPFTLHRLVKRIAQRRENKARAEAARLGMAAYVNLNPHLIGVGMRQAQWKRSRRDPDMGAAR